MSSPGTAPPSEAITRAASEVGDSAQDQAAGDGEEELPEKLRFLLAQSSIYAQVIAQKLQKDTEDRRKRDEAAGKRAQQKERKQAQKQAATGNERRSGRAATRKAAATTTAAPAKHEEPSMLSSEDDSESDVKARDFGNDKDASKSTPARKSRTKYVTSVRSSSGASAGESELSDPDDTTSASAADEDEKSVAPKNGKAAKGASPTKGAKSSGKGQAVNGKKPGKKAKKEEILSDEDMQSGDDAVPAAMAKAEGAEEPDKSRQPSLVTGATMKTYQVAGMEWLISLYENGLNGILADEMGLGKTLQTIAFLAYLREKGVWGPFLVCCPLSTLANWVNEFERFTPDIPVVLYHGTPQERADLREERLQPPVDDKSATIGSKGRGKSTGSRRYRNTTQTFPIVVTSYELIINDRQHLSKYNWKYLIIDESHRIKNLNCKLIKELMNYKSANRLLLTGTPLQNNLEELWSLLNFLVPEIFDDLDSFKSWFDIDVTAESSASQQIITKLHAILKPFLLRRIKRDVEKALPPKKEYLLSAPLTVQQKSLYDAVLKRQIRDFLLAKKELIPDTELPNFTTDEEPDTATASDEDDDDEVTKAAKKATKSQKAAAGKGAKGKKRTAEEAKLTNGSASKKGKSSGASTPASASKRARPASYADVGEQDFLQSLEDGSAHTEATKFEKRRYGNNITMEGFGKITGAEESDEDEDLDEADKKANRIAKTATKKINRLKLSNMVMQLRKVVNHPWLFDWPMDPKTGEYVLDDRIIASSGKMMLLERLLEKLFATDHKVLVFSQFTTQLDIIEDWAVEWKGWNICRIDGHTKQEDRRSQLKDFNENKGPDSPKLFLLSTRSGGVGINLTGADTVVLFDSDWNPQMDLQAMDRVHRLGQTKPVLIFRLVTANTIEAKMLERAGNKRKLEALVIGSGKYTASLDDLQDIFSGKAGTSSATGEKAAGIAASMFADEMRDQNAREAGVDSKEKEIHVIQEGEEVISEDQLAMLLDRSEEAMTRGKGWKAKTKDSKAFEVIETVAAGGEDGEKDSLAELFKNKDSRATTPKTDPEDDEE